MVLCADDVEEVYIFAVIMDPFRTLYLAPYIFNILCKWKNKIYENDRISSKLKVLPNINYLKLLK